MYSKVSHVCIKATATLYVCVYNLIYMPTSSYNFLNRITKFGRTIWIKPVDCWLHQLRTWLYGYWPLSADH